MILDGQTQLSLTVPCLVGFQEGSANDLGIIWYVQETIPKNFSATVIFRYYFHDAATWEHMNINRQRPEEARPKSNSSDVITWPTRGDVWSQDVRIYPKTLRSPPKRRVGYLGHGTGTRMRPTSLPGRWWVSFHLIPATRFVLRLLERQAGYLICFRTRTVMCCCLSQSKCFRMRSSTGQIQHDKPKGGPICWTCNKLTQAPIVSNCHSAESQSLAETCRNNVLCQERNIRTKWRGIPLNFRQQQIQY